MTGRTPAPYDGPGPGRAIGPRVLVVDSDPGTRALCRRVLEDAGYVVDVRDSGVAALAAARQNPPTLILLDLQLHDVEGVQFIKWLRSDPSLESIPVIPISATAEDAARLPPGNLGALLRKPLSAAMIARALRTAVPSPA